MFYHLFKRIFRSLCPPQHLQKKILKQFEVVRFFFSETFMSNAMALSPELDIGPIEFVIEKALGLFTGPKALYLEVLSPELYTRAGICQFPV